VRVELTVARPKNPDLAGKTERIDTRVSPETRLMLEDAAARSGLSLSREIEQRLVQSLDAERLLDEAGSREAEALLRAIGVLITNIEERTAHSWQSDRFTHGETAKGVALLLSRLRPAGDGAPPPEFPTNMPSELPDMKRFGAQQYKRQGGLGAVCALALIDLMRRDAPARTAAPTGFANNNQRDFNNIFRAERAAGRVLRDFLRDKDDGQ
jgi:hypothetical protein